MKRRTFAICMVLVMVLVMFSGFAWNKDIFDTVFAYDRAVLGMPDGTVVSGKVQSWTDYEDGDQIQVKIDGVTYLAHSSQVVLIAE